MLPLLLALGLAAQTELRGEALMSALQSGGYTIMLRHTKTDRTVNEGPNYGSLKRAEQRNLNDEGVRDAKLIGVVMKRYGIPIGEILASQMYRTRETAEYAFGDPTPHPELQELAASAAQRALVVGIPKAGTNRVIVTHHFIIERYAPGIRPGDLAEGEAAVVQPAGDGTLTLVGRFKLADWQALAPAAPAAPAAVAASPIPIHGPPVVLPQTNAGRIARAYLQAFNTGDSAAMRGFMEGFMVVNPARSMADRLETFRTLFGEHGPLTTVSIESSVEDTLTLTIHSKQGGMSMTVKASAEQPGRGSSIAMTFGRRDH